MRLIDADEVLQEIEESANAVEIQIHLGKVNKDVAKGMLSGLALVRENILRKPTAYDVEAVIVELGCASYQTESTFDEDGYCNDDSEDVVELNTAIEIVRGKE